MIMLYIYRWVAACCRSLSSWHLVLCSQSLSLSLLSLSLSQPVQYILRRLLQSYWHVLFGPFRRFRRALLYYEDYLVWLGILHDLHSLWHASHHCPSYAQRLAASPTSKDVWGLLSYLLDTTGMTQLYSLLGDNGWFPPSLCWIAMVHPLLLTYGEIYRGIQDNTSLLLLHSRGIHASSQQLALRHSSDVPRVSCKTGDWRNKKRIHHALSIFDCSGLRTLVQTSTYTMSLTKELYRQSMD